MSHTVVEPIPVDEGSLGSRSILSRLRPLPDVLMIGSILTLVVLTSLPRLRAFVLRSNEADAREMVVRLAAEPYTDRDIGAWIQASSELRRRLQDGTLHGDGSLLCYHGFCFSVEGQGPGDRVVIAWPEIAGESGRGAYLASGDELWVHPNVDGPWSGFEASAAGERPHRDRGWRSINN